MQTLPTIETERLLLTSLKADDIPDIVQYANNENISKYTINLPSPYFEKDAIYWLNLAHQGLKNGTNYIFAVRLKADASFVGGISLTVEKRFSRAEISYWMAEPFWSKGYTSEATKAIMQFGFDKLGLNKLTSSHLGANVASGKVMQNAGMSKEGELVEHICKEGVFHNLVLYGITQKQYQALKE